MWVRGTFFIRTLRDQPALNAGNDSDGFVFPVYPSICRIYLPGRAPLGEPRPMQALTAEGDYPPARERTVYNLISDPTQTNARLHLEWSFYVLWKTNRTDRARF